VARVGLSLNLQLEFLQGAIASQGSGGDGLSPDGGDEGSESTYCENGSSYCEPEPDC
jgi:hypothetical protein